MTERPRLLLVDVSDRDRADPAYGRVLRTLSESVRGAGTRTGFDVRRVAADTADLAAELAQADAVILTGGEDVDPELYDGPADYPGRAEIFGDSDRAQADLVRSAVDSGIPVVGICRGMQLVNVALGGDLVQHLGDAGHVADGPADGPMVSHAVHIDSGSALAGIVGASDLEVQSSHHQAVATPGRGLRVVARSADGTAEAIEHESAPVWAVQWHPEDAGSSGTVLDDLLRAAREAGRREPGRREPGRREAGRREPEFLRPTPNR